MTNQYFNILKSLFLSLFNKQKLLNTVGFYKVKIMVGSVMKHNSTTNKWKTKLYIINHL